MRIFDSYLLPPEKVGQVLGVEKNKLRLLVFEHFVIVWASKKSSAGAGE